MEQGLLDRFNLVKTNHYIGNSFISDSGIYQNASMENIYFMECDMEGNRLDNIINIVYRKKGFYKSICVGLEFLNQFTYDDLTFFIENEFYKQIKNENN